MKKSILCAILLSFCLCQTTEALRAGFNCLHPTSHVSASGEYALFVDPSHIMGSGPADYRLTRQGETVWTNRFPFSLWNAAVSDSGIVAGVAYSHGWEGYPIKDFEDRPGDFSVILLSPEGTLIAKDSVSRKGGGCNGPPHPVALDIFFDGLTSNAVVRVDDNNRTLEPWWIYDLASGQRTNILKPGDAMANREGSRYILTAKSIPSMPLFLLHWWRYGGSISGADFTLVDADGKPVWELSLPRDYMVPDKDKWGNPLLNHIKRNSAILHITPHGTFDLHHVREGARVSYAIEQSKSGQWDAREIGRAPYQWTASAANTSPPPATANLEKLGEIQLAAVGGESSNAFAGVEAFDFDSEGRICALKNGRDQPSLLYLTQQGDILAEVRLPVDTPPDYPYVAGPASVGGQRFVAGFTLTNNVTLWFLADFEKNDIRLIAQVEDSNADAVAGFPDGRFAALTRRRRPHNRTHGLSMLNSTGKVYWTIDDDAGYSHEPEEFLSPEDVATCGSNQIAVMDNIRHTIQVFDDRGNFQRIVDFDDVWDRKPSYPTDLAPDVDGGFIVYDFCAKESLLRLHPDGTIRKASSPRYADGSLFRVYDGVKRSPQGDLWTCDGISLMRLDDEGRADLILGPVANAAALSEPRLAAVGPGDRIYVADKRTKAIHVFDSSGTCLGRCHPDPEDLKETSFVDHFAFAPDGRLFATLDFGAKDYLEFGPDFARIGWSPTPPTERRFGEGRYFQPNSSNLWVAGMHDLMLFDAASNLLRVVSRRADGQWLERPDLASVAPDGSIAIRASSQTRPPSINVYDADGHALSTFNTPYHRRFSDHHPFAPLAYDGRRIFARNGNRVSLHDIHGERLGVFSFATEEVAKKWSGPFLAAVGKELWFIAPEEFTVHRFAVPD